MRFGFLFVAFAVLASVVRADRASDLAAIHTEVIGGKKRIEALKSLRATGNVTANGKQVRFTMTAARPDKIRVETEMGGRTLVQGSDGVAAPWEFDTGTWPPKYTDMPDASAKTFVADAEFDDPLVSGAARGFTIEYAGEVSVEGKKLHRLLVTRKLIQTFSLLLDPETFFIVTRVEQRPTVSGRQVQVVTHYEDFRPVEGVLLPHQIAVVIDGKVTQHTKIVAVEPNPTVTAETFTRPKVAVPGVRKT
jgi:hypothetical protein